MINRSGPKSDWEFKDFDVCEKQADGSLKKITKCLVLKSGVLTDKSFYLDELGEEYTVVDEKAIVPCPDSDCFPVTKWIFENGIIPNGVTEQYWQVDQSGVGNGVGTPGQNPAPPITTIFSNTDDCGVIQHPNEGSEDAINILPLAIPTDPANGGNSADWVAHESCLDFWVCVDQPNVSIAARVNGFSSFAVYFGSCTGKLQLVEQGINTQFAGAAFYDVNLGSVGKGFFHVRLYSHDPYQFGKTILQWSTDGGNTYGDIPTENLISERPSASCTTLLLDKATGEYTYLDGTPLGPNTKCFDCSPCDIPTGLPPQLEEDCQVLRATRCDKALTGEVTKYYRYTVLKDGKVDSEYDTTIADSTVTYVPSGKDGDCDSGCGSTECYWNQTKTIPAGTVGDILDIIAAGTDASGNYCAPTCAYIQVRGEGTFTKNNGGVPSADFDGDYAGFYFGDCDIIPIGCCDTSTGTGSAKELQDFRIAASPDADLIISVMLCRKV